MNYDSFDGWTDEQIANFMSEQGYNLPYRKLEDGEYIMLVKLAYTMSVCCGVTPLSVFKYRWCFEDESEAFHFFNTCKEFDEVPAQRNSLRGHRYQTSPLLVEYDEFNNPKW